MPFRWSFYFQDILWQLILKIYKKINHEPLLEIILYGMVVSFKEILKVMLCEMRKANW